MTTLFRIDNDGNVIYTEEALAIKPFRELYERDTSNTKREAWLKLAAAFFLASVSSLNPYKGYEKEERLDIVANDLFDGNEEEILGDKLIPPAIDKIIEIEETSLMKGLLRTALKSLGKLRKYLEETDLTEKGADGKPLFDPKKYHSILNELTSTGKSLRTLEQEVRREDEGDRFRNKGDVADEFPI